MFDFKFNWAWTYLTLNIANTFVLLSYQLVPFKTSFAQCLLKYKPSLSFDCLFQKFNINTFENSVVKLLKFSKWLIYDRVLQAKLCGTHTTVITRINEIGQKINSVPLGRADAAKAHSKSNTGWDLYVFGKKNPPRRSFHWKILL